MNTLLFYTCRMKIKQEPLCNSTTKRHQLNTKGSNGQINKDNNRSTLQLKQEAFIKNIKDDEAQESTILIANKSTSYKLNTSNCQSNHETNVKQEHLSKPEALLHGNVTDSKLTSRQSVEPDELEPDINDPEFYCCLCKRTYVTRFRYRRHLRSIHQMKFDMLRPRKNPNVVPDWDDPNCYCKSCERTYDSRRKYSTHCKRVHKLKPTPIVIRKGILCNVCHYTYQSKGSYSVHCLNMHNIKHEKLFANPEATPDMQDPNNYCSKCDKRFSNRRSFKNHLICVHKLFSLLPKNNVEPDIHDPNFYCQTCNTTLPSKRAYQVHLATIHCIGPLPRKMNKAHPDVDDPNHHCRVCQQTYASQYGYRRHLQATHQLVLYPDPLDPNFYCRVCNRTSKTLRLYRRHCKTVHRMELYHRSILNPSATIDINSPNRYCAQCQRQYSSKSAYAYHLQAIHHL